MNDYGALARFYDLFTSDIDYKKIAAEASAAFSVGDIPTRSVLDLGCGTGSLTYCLAYLGYDMVGAEPSPDMLSIALKKAESAEKDILFLNQSGEELDLNDTVDACVLSLDVVNHITDKEDLARTFRKIHLFMNKGGILYFDMNTPQKFLSMYDGGCYAWEQDGVYCVLHSEKDKSTGLYVIDHTFFELMQGVSYTRYDDTVWEKSYDTDEIIQLLSECGFEVLKIKASEGGNRMWITSKKT